jgi:hypothetical protein
MLQCYLVDITLSLCLWKMASLRFTKLALALSGLWTGTFHAATQLTKSVVFQY